MIAADGHSYRCSIGPDSPNLRTSIKDRNGEQMPRTDTSNDSQQPTWSVPSLREPRYSQSLERGLAILSCFTPTRPVLGIADIADHLGMSRSTTHRYV
jgi:IclR family pca regulon transcriptional regulator